MNRRRVKKILAYVLIFVLFVSAGGSYIVSADENPQAAQGFWKSAVSEKTQTEGIQQEQTGSFTEETFSEGPDDQQENQESEDSGGQEGTDVPEDPADQEDSEAPEDPEKPKEDGTSEGSQEQEDGEQSDETVIEDNSQKNPQEDTADTQETFEEQDVFEEEKTETVVSWSWEDTTADVVYSQDKERWELILSEEDKKDLTKESLEEMLPKAIEGFVNEEKEKIAVEWKLDETSVLKETEEYTAKAQLPQPYVVSQDSTPLEITAVTNEPQSLANDEVFDKYLVSGVSPKGTTINLFDYWNSDYRWTEINGNSDKGINQGHRLQFNAGNPGDGVYDPINKWTGTSDPLSGMVSKTLEGGYPTLKKNGDLHIENDESLSYLFSGNDGNGKKAFTDVKGLLQVTDDGYYYYDATEDGNGNFAVFNETNNSFKLYETWAVNPVTERSPKGQFFPFNSASDVFTEDFGNQPYITQNNIKANDPRMNHYFGLSMTSRFVQVDGGMNKGQHVTYEFSGDDDVWIYIDNVLVADLGGIHDKASVSIDFFDGTVTINNDINTKRSLEEIYREALQGNFNPKIFNDKGTFKDKSYHTLNFFYLERGAGDSNMSLKYNLVTVPESGIVKVDQIGNGVSGAEFELIATDDEYVNQLELIASGVTNDDGTLVFTDKDGFLVSLNDLVSKGYKNFILRETAVPPGYRILGDLHLYIPEHQKANVLLAANPWETGSYAAAKVNVSAPEDVQGINGTQYNLQNGLMFGVVMKYMGTGEIENIENWRPVSGTALEGWKVWDSVKMEAILGAAKENPVIFTPTSSGSYESEIEQLPGDIRNYYFMQEYPGKDNVKYTTAYFYTTESDLNQANVSNTYRIESNQFERVFAATVYVPNIENHLYVQKFDDNKEQPLVGAEFSLYKANQVDESGNLKPDAEPYDSVTTDAETDIYNVEGGAMFPSDVQDCPLIEGETYYLKETKAPEGYALNDTLVKVIVDHSGVYADAGDENDGIFVERGVGKLVHSMIQFAPNDKIDATLHDIKAIPQKSEGGGNWNWQNIGDTDNELHLSYSGSPKDYEYGANTPGDPTTITTSTGWARLKIEQCLEHDASIEDETPKTTLSGVDLTGLYSGLTNVQVTDTAIGNLYISKKVNNDNASEFAQNQDFYFELNLKQNGVSYTRPITIQKSGGNTEQKEYDSAAQCYSFELKGGESIKILDLPLGLQFKVQEVQIPTGYHPSVKVDSVESQTSDTATGTISHKTGEGGVYVDNTVSVEFTNTYSYDLILTGDTAVKGQKTLEGRNIKDSDSFTFSLEPDGEKPVNASSGDTTEDKVEKKLIIPDKSKIVISGDGTTSVKEFDFGSITVKETGTYKFYIKEQIPSSPGDIKYDNHIASVTFTVEERNGVLALTPDGMVYDNSTAVSEEDVKIKDKAAFTNSVVTDFKFKKTDENSAPLSGAYFGIYRQICMDNHSDELVETDGNGNPTASQCWELISQAASDSNGQVHFLQIPMQNNATYRLVEYKAPGGYVKPSGQWCLICKDGEIQFCEGEGGSVGNPPAVNSETNSIKNYKATKLPFAGNTGIQIFLTLGGTLMGIGGLTGLWCWRRKKQKTARG